MTKIIDSPIITVITVVFNGEEYLEETILSVINQTYPNVEYIIVDGASTDNTIEIIKKYEDKIDCWISEPDNGIYDAMNKGIDLARGSWINFMNAGDSFVDDRVLSNVALHLCQPLDILYGNVVVKYNGYTKYRVAGNIEKLWQGSQFCHQASFVNTNLYKIIKFNVKNKIGGDFEFFYRAYSDRKIFRFLDLPIALYSVGGISDVERLQSHLSHFKTVCKLEKNFTIFLYYSGIMYLELIKKFVKLMIKVFKVTLWKN